MSLKQIVGVHSHKIYSDKEQKSFFLKVEGNGRTQDNLMKSILRDGHLICLEKSLIEIIEKYELA